MEGWGSLICKPYRSPVCSFVDCYCDESIFFLLMKWKMAFESSVRRHETACHTVIAVIRTGKRCRHSGHNSWCHISEPYTWLWFTGQLDQHSNSLWCCWSWKIYIVFFSFCRGKLSGCFSLLVPVACISSVWSCQSTEPLAGGWKHWMVSRLGRLERLILSHSLYRSHDEAHRFGQHFQLRRQLASLVIAVIDARVLF